ncbi:MAG: hypothetical protein ACRD0P_33230 [Stackebrandtia sp.]
MRRTVRATPTKRTVPSCGTRGDRAYLVAADDEETADVDIVDVTDPKHPVFVGDFDLNVYNVSQPELAHTDSFLHDMVVKQIGDRFIMLLSYCDGGWVLLDVTDPAIRSSSATATTPPSTPSSSSDRSQPHARETHTRRSSPRTTSLLSAPTRTSRHAG